MQEKSSTTNVPTSTETLILENQIEPTTVPVGLFDRIICAVKEEKDHRETKNLFTLFLSLFLLSAMAMPFSWTLFANQSQQAGTYHFVTLPFSSPDMFFHYWQDFTLAILESLPMVGMLLLIMNTAFLVFSLRLFLYKDGAIFHTLNLHGKLE